VTARREGFSDDAPSASTRPSTHDVASPWWTLVAVECGNFAVYMDGFIVTLALPAMAREFSVGIRSVEVAATLGILGAIISAQRGPDVRPEGR
jgi:hypothetical protein